METDKQYSMFRSWKFQDNQIHRHQLAWSMNQSEYSIYGCNISSSFFTVMYYCLSDTASMAPCTTFETIYSIDSTALYACRPLELLVQFCQLVTDDWDIYFIYILYIYIYIYIYTRTTLFAMPKGFFQDVWLIAM